MKIYVLGIPHTILCEENEDCAFTAKTGLLLRMLSLVGVDYCFLGHASSEYMEKYKHEYMFPLAPWDACDALPAIFRERCKNVIKMNAVNGDMLLCTYGTDHQEIAAEAEKLGMIIIESGIGYEHQFAPFRVFESHAWKNATYGKENRLLNPSWSDVVIPNAVDVDRFTLMGFPGGDYGLFIGRATPLKGLSVAERVCKKSGIPLHVMGEDPGRELEWGTYVGKKTGPAKVSEIQGAKFLICPTLYIEPFGNVAIEAQSCGVPVIASPHGAFVETVIDDVTGFICHTPSEFERAIDCAGTLSPYRIRERIMSEYSIRRVAGMYSHYLTRVHDIFTDGWWSA